MTVTHVDFGRPKDDEDGFRGPTVCALAGISYRQLDYWARTGLAAPTAREAAGSGTQRLYSEADALRVCVVATLLQAGFSLSVLRERVSQILQGASDGVGFFSADNVTVTIDLAALHARIQAYLPVTA